MQSFWNYHRVYRLHNIYIVLTQKYIEFLSADICTCDANKRKTLDSAQQTVRPHFKPTFFFSVVVSPLEEESVILPVYTD